MGRIATPARQGVLHNTLASHADPDTTHTVSVDLSQSGGVLHSGSMADADQYRTLCYVDGELVSYETATLTGANLYGLTYLRRGVYGSTIAAHAAGTKFCRLDDSAASFDLPITPVSYVGQTLYLKFASFNIYGGGQQNIADVTAIAYNPNGAGVFVFPPTGVSFTVGAEQQADGSWISFGVVAWTASQDPLFDQYEVQYRLHTGPGPWISWRGGPDTTSFRISPLAPNTAYDVQVRAVRTSGPFFSAWDQTLNISSAGKTTAPPAPTSLTVNGGYRQITLDWVASAENDIAWYEVYEGPDNVRAHSTKIGQVNATHYLRPGLNLSDTRFYWIRAQDTSGNFSAYLGPGNATTNAVDAGDITGQIVNTQIQNAAIDGSKLANSIIDYSKMASGYGIAASVNALPAVGSPLRYAGSLVLLTSNAKLYRWDSVGNAWTVATDGADITANSIVANALVAGIITSPYLAAGAVTADKLFIGDTTNFITDPIFQDQNYWTINGSGAVTSFITPATTTTLGTNIVAHVAVASIPAGSSVNYGIKSGFVAVRQGVNYRASCQASVGGAGVNKASGLYIQWYDHTLDPANPSTYSGAFISNSQSGGPTTAGGLTGLYASTDQDASSIAFTASNGAEMLAVDTAPSGASWAQLFWFVAGGGGSAPAGTGSGWNAAHMRLERQTVGTLIQNGAITTDHINVAGLDGGAITAGTVTGDRMDAHFIDSETFSTIHTSGQPFVEIDGKSHTVTSHQNGPWFRVNDGTRDRVIIGQKQDDWGLWIYDSAGNPFFEEYQLANGTVVTGHLANNAVTFPFAFTQSGSLNIGPTGWTTIWSQSVTLNATSSVLIDTLFFGSFLAGTGTTDSFRIKLDGTVVTAINAVGRKMITVGAGSHTIVIEGQGDPGAPDTFVLPDGATATILACQK
jgi:hypothetical protein